MKYQRNHEVLLYFTNGICIANFNSIQAEHGFDIYWPRLRRCFAVYYNSSECWIGLYKSVAERSDASTYWLDGNPSTYRNWRAGEPNENNRCIRIHGGLFRDVSCNNRYRYICKGSQLLTM